MLIAQISDTHIGLPTSLLETSGRTSEHLQRAVAHLVAMSPRPDAVVLSGDCVDAGSVEEYERLAKLLEPLPMPVHLAVGNHDDATNLARVFDRHATLLDESFLQYEVRHGDLRLLILDTRIPGAPSGHLCERRLAWLDERLAEDTRAPTLVFLHHPPYRSGLPAMDAMGLDSSEALGEIIGRYSNIERVLSGHIHRPTQFRFHGTVAQTCPSTAHQLALGLEPDPRLSVVMEPPACLLHHWNGTDLVTHTSYIGDYGPVTVLHDGEKWLTPTS